MTRPVKDRLITALEGFPHKLQDDMTEIVKAGVGFIAAHHDGNIHPARTAANEFAEYLEWHLSAYDARTFPVPPQISVLGTDAVDIVVVLPWAERRLCYCYDIISGRLTLAVEDTHGWWATQRVSV